MEERKRSIAVDSDDVYPSKRQATAVNGSLPRMDPDKEKDIESFQKEAILRQMREYKREKSLYEGQVAELTKRSAYHDDHLRTIDAWFTQLLDEIRVLVGDIAAQADTASGSELFRSALTFDDNAAFEEHLKTRSSKIKAAITDIFGRLPTATPDVQEVQERLAALLANEKAHIVESQRIIGERDQLGERLEQASYRYLLAEKKLDRAKSATVQKLERQAIMGGNSETAGAADRKASVKSEDTEMANGDVDSSTHAAAEIARKEAVAAAEKRKIQAEQLEAENKQLTEELTTAKTRMASLTDEDYSKTDLYKMLKSQHEDTIKRINNLEATNVQLREEAQKLQAERTTWRDLIEEESRAATSDLESQLARAETDLSRIRNLRDELAAENAVRKGSQDQQSSTADQFKELAESRETRIAALESETQRLKLQTGEANANAASETIDNMSVDDLKTKLRNLESSYALLENELPSLETAWRKTQALASKKVKEIADWEEQKSRIHTEKAKADQKYFAAMKAKEAREVELRTLKAQNARSSEIVSQLKDAEGNSRALTINLEKQLSESKESLASLSQQNRALQQKVNEGNIVLEGLRSEITELKKLVLAKDSTAQSAASSRRQAEVELEELKVRLEDSKKNVESLKKKGSAKDSDGSDDWRVTNRNLFGLQFEPAELRY
ncbi:hypothetical protein MBLNU459_g5335t1 [Dothideomycetes sp. NU459]